MKMKNRYQIGALYNGRVSLKGRPYRSYFRALIELLLSFKRWKQMGYVSRLVICKID